METMYVISYKMVAPGKHDIVQEHWRATYSIAKKEALENCTQDMPLYIYEYTIRTKHTRLRAICEYKGGHAVVRRTNADGSDRKEQGNTVNVNMRLDTDIVETLKAHCEEKNIGFSTMLRNLVKAGLTRGYEKTVSKQKMEASPELIDSINKLWKTRLELNSLGKNFYQMLKIKRLSQEQFLEEKEEILVQEIEQCIGKIDQAMETVKGNLTCL